MFHADLHFVLPFCKHVDYLLPFSSSKQNIKPLRIISRTFPPCTAGLVLDRIHQPVLRPLLLKNKRFSFFAEKQMRGITSARCFASAPWVGVCGVEIRISSMFVPSGLFEGKKVGKFGREQERVFYFYRLCRFACRSMIRLSWSNRKKNESWDFGILNEESVLPRHEQRIQIF